MLFSRSLLVMALSLVMILIGINSQSGWLFWLAGLLLAALLVSWSISLFQVRNLAVVRRHREEAEEGEPLRVVLEIRNRGRLSRSLLEVVDEDPCGVHPRRGIRLKEEHRPLREQLRDPSPPPKRSPADSGGRAAFVIPRLEPGGSVSLTYQRRGLRRGVYRDWPAFFYSEGVIGLARHSSRARVESRLAVLPRYAELRSFPLVDSFLHQQRMPQEYSSKKGSGIDYYGVREFRPGDPLRHVHWRTTARRGDLTVKDFERETGTPLVVLVDNRPGNGPGKGRSDLLDSEARLAASVAHYAHYAGHPVTLAAYRGDRPELYDVPSFHAALVWLAALEPVGGTGIEEQLEGLRSELSPGCFFCCITPAQSLDRSRLAAALPPMCRVAMVLVDTDSHNGNGGARLTAPGSSQAVSSLMAAPFAGLFSISLYRKDEDLRKCLEEPLIIYGGSTPRGR